MTSVPLSILDLAAIGTDETIAESVEGSVALARLSEDAGYGRTPSGCTETASSPPISSTAHT